MGEKKKINNLKRYSVSMYIVFILPCG